MKQALTDMRERAALQDLLRKPRRERQVEPGLAILTEIAGCLPDRETLVWQQFRPSEDDAARLRALLAQLDDVDAPKTAFGWHVVAEAWLWLRDEDGRAIAAAHQALWRDADQANTHRDLIWLAIWGRSEYEALASARRLLELRPRSAEALYLMGEVAEWHAPSEDSVAYFRRALKRDRKFWQAELGLAYSLYRLDRDEEALRHAERAVALRPDIQSAHRILARITRWLGRKEASLAAWQALAELRPEDREAYEARRDLDLELERFDEGLEMVESWPEIREVREHFAEADGEDAGMPEWLHAQLMLDRASFLQSKGLDPKAREVLDEVAAFLPEATGLQLEYARLLRETSREERALGVYARLLRKDPGRVGLHFQRAVTLAELGRHAEAARGFERASALDERNPNASYLAAVQYVELREFSRARLALERAFSIDESLREKAREDGDLADFRDDPEHREWFESLSDS